jgi:NCS1 family nucleobase:cation symporter-1
MTEKTGPKKFVSSTVNRELLPASKKERVISAPGYFAVWIGNAVMIGCFAVGGACISYTNAVYIMIASIFAVIITGFFITLSGEVGVEHGIPFPVIMRLSCGHVGSVVPNMMNFIIHVSWFGIQTYFGAIALDYILFVMTGVSAWVAIYYIFLVVQAINAAFGAKAVEKMAKFAAPIIIIVTFWILIVMLGEAEMRGIDAWRSVVSPGGDIIFQMGPAPRAFLITFIMNLTFWSTCTADSQSLTKYVYTKEGEQNWFKRNWRCLLAHCVALPICQTFIVMVAGMSMVIFGTYNPIEALQSFAGGPLLIAIMLFIVLGQWTTNVATSVLPGAFILLNSLSTIIKTKIPYWVACALCCIIPAVIQPWRILDQFQAWLGIMGGVYGPLCGVIIFDYYFLRRRRINMPDLFIKDGQYAGFRGWNFAGIIAIAVGFVCGMLTGVYSWPISVATAGISYMILSKVWWIKKYPQKEIESGYDDKYLGVSVGNYWQDIDAKI